MADALLILEAAAGRSGSENRTTYVSLRLNRKRPRTPRRKLPSP